MTAATPDDEHLRVAVAAMLSGPAAAEGCERLTRSSHQILVDASVSYLRTIGAESMRAAHHSGRSHVNMLDLVATLNNLPGLTPLEDVLAFAASDVRDAPVISTTVQGAASVSSGLTSLQQKHRPLHAPEFLPPFPSPHTFKSTATCTTRTHEAASVRKHVAQLRRGASSKLGAGRTSVRSALPHAAASAVQAAPACSSRMSVDRAVVCAVSAPTALPYKELCSRELTQRELDTSGATGKASDILHRQHARGLDEAVTEELGNDASGA